MNDADVLVVGGGISGLSAAWWLARHGLSVEIWEREAKPGGRIRSDTANGYVTERAAALVMNFLPQVNQLVAESGLDTAKTPRRAALKRYLIDDGRLAPVPMKLGALLASPLWSLPGKLRLVVEPFIPKGGHAEETVSEFIARRLGREMLEKAMEPYVAGPLASDPDQVNAYTVLPRLTALERRYGSLAVGMLAHRILRRPSSCASEAFSFEGGMSTLVKALTNTPGIRFRPGHNVTELTRRRQGWQVTGRSQQGERTLQIDQVVLSIPADAAATVLDPLDNELSTLIRGIPYAPLSVVHLGFDKSVIQHPLDGTGFLTPRRERLAINGNLWMSSLFAGRAPPGKTLLTSYLGGARLPSVADWDDGRCLSAAVSDLRSLLGINGDPEMVRIDRHPQGLPQYAGAYCGRMQAIDARLQRLPGLHVEANYRGGVSVRDRITQGHTVAGRIAAEIVSGKRYRATVTGKARAPTEKPAIAVVEA